MSTSPLPELELDALPPPRTYRLGNFLPSLICTPLCLLALGLAPVATAFLRTQVGGEPVPLLTVIFLRHYLLFAGLCAMLGVGGVIFSLAPSRQLGGWATAMTIAAQVAVLLLYAWALAKPFVMPGELLAPL